MSVDRLTGVRDSLRAQLLWWLVPPVLAVLTVSSLASYVIALKVANNAYDVGLFDQARSLAQQVRFNSEGKPVLQLPRAAEEIILSDPFDRIYYRVYEPSGESVAGRADLPGPSEEPTPDQPLRLYDAKVDNEPVRVSAYGLFNGGESVTAIVLAAETLVKRKQLSKRVMLVVLAPLITLILVMATVIWFGVRRGLVPLQRLAEAVSQRGWNDLTTIGDHGTPQEVRPLTHAIDDLMRRLRIALGAQQRFIAEAAHQLRTPLAGLTAQTERTLLANDIETTKLALAQLQVALGRVTRLVNQLLTLARAEPGSDPAHEFQLLDLAGLVQRTCMEWVPEALEKDVDLGFAGESEPVMVKGNETLLMEMLNNLIDNALRYGARLGGSVTVRLARSPHIELSVEDDGPGIPEEEQSRIFERFHRVPGTSPGGSGLGLAIVREIVRAHGGEVSVHSRSQDGGTVFRVVFSEV